MCSSRATAWFLLGAKIVSALPNAEPKAQQASEDAASYVPRKRGPQRLSLKVSTNE
jgi:hypothetical protein